MMSRVGIERRLDTAVLLSLILLVAITPLGSEATHPVVLGAYRTLLVLISFLTAVRLRQFDLTKVSVWFLATCAVVVFGMLGSVLLRPGSHFDGLYTFYQNLLFLVAFIALTSYGRTRSAGWKAALSAALVLTNITYIAGAWFYRMHHPGPLTGPFVNANYFASYLLPAFAICAAGAIFSSSLKIRIASVLSGLILFFGIVQTTSRGAFLSAMVLLALGLFRGARRKGISRIAVAGVAILVVIAVLIASPTLTQKFTDHGQRDPYNYQRTEIWLKTLSMIAEHPGLGVGLAKYYYVSKLYTPAVDGTIARYPRWANIAHSEYLQYAAELGLPIAFLMFAIGMFLFKSMWQRAETIAPESRVFQEAAILAAAGLGIHALVGNNWTVPVIAAGLAVISMADLLPFEERTRFQWTPVRMASAGLFGFAVYFQAVLLPSVGLYFNEAGHQAYLAGNFVRAEMMHRLAVGFIPGDPLLLDNLGTVYFDEFTNDRNPNLLDRAEMLFQESISLNSRFDLPAGHLESVLFLRLSGNLAKDRPIHERIVAVDSARMRANPYNSFTRSNLAEALHNLGRNQEAMDELRKCVEIEPNYVQAYMRLAQWEDEAGNHQGAENDRRNANSIVTQYKNQTNLDPLEARLLDRPVVKTGKP